MPDGEPWLLAVLAVLAIYRLTRLVNQDVVTAPLRRFVLRLDERHGPLDDGEVGRWTYFITCPWCVSIWVGAVVSTVAVLWGDNRVVLIGLLALAGSAVTGWLSSWEAEL